MMTIAELITALQGKDPTLRVVTRGYEGGYADIDIEPAFKIVLNVHKEWYYGPHDRPEDDETKPTEWAICL